MNVRSILAGCPLFAGLSDGALDWIAHRVTVQSVQGGELLFHAGSVCEFVFILAAGRLRAINPDGSLAGDIARLEPVGEISLLSGDAHHSSVYALRDSLLLRIEAADWLQLGVDYPSALLETTRIIIRRLRARPRQSLLGTARAAQTFVVLAAYPGAPARAIAQALADSLGVMGEARVIDAQSVDEMFGKGASQAVEAEDGEASARVFGWLNECESVNRHLVYLANESSDAWTRRCLRQADRVLVVAECRERPQQSATTDVLRQVPLHAPIELVLLRENAVDSGDVLKWRQQVQARAHYFLRPGNVRDVGAFARQVAGSGIGLVLGGGGARGFAHIGLLRAIEELQIPIDLVGGTSMGAFFAALHACGHGWREMVEIARETFVTHNYLNDYILPRIALIRGRKFLGRLHEIFGDRRIEDLYESYFCVSTNLSRATTVVHDQGPLYLWLGASMSVPGMGPPVVWRGDLLADGAVLNGLPTDIMQNLARGPIIASDVSSENGPRLAGVEGPDPEALLKQPKNGVSMFDLLFRTATLTSESGVRMRAERADVYLRMPVSGVALFDWKRLDEVVERGYDAAMKELNYSKSMLLDALHGIGLPPRAPNENLTQAHDSSQIAALISGART